MPVTFKRLMLIPKHFYSLVKKIWDAQRAGGVSKYDKFNHSMSAQPQSWADVRDHRGRTVLHAAVENGNMTLSKTLVSAGVDVNVKERCRASPPTLAVIRCVCICIWYGCCVGV